MNWGVVNLLTSCLRRSAGEAFVGAGAAAGETRPSVSGDVIAYIMDSAVAVFDTVTMQTTQLTNDAFIQSEVKFGFL